MTGIDRYISELLFDHDCVILPGVGGFLTNYSGARIHPIRHSFQPAARTLVFNANLRTNDGLLIDYVSRAQSISYQQASLLVNEFAAQCNRELEAGKAVTFNNIGRCRMGKEKNIIFDPDENSNYLADAFGLPSFVSPAIKRETVRQRLEKQLTPKPSAPKEEKKINLRPVIGWAAGIAIPIAAAVLLYMYTPTIMDGLGNSYASFVPTVKFKTSEPAGKPGELNKNAEFADFRVIPEKLSEAPAEPEPEKAGEAMPEAVGMSVIKKYQIVVGAFSREANAEKYVNELRGRNYDAGIIGKSSNGLTRVSISGFDARKDALSMLGQVRADENPAAWLLVVR